MAASKLVNREGREEKHLWSKYKSSSREKAQLRSVAETESFFFFFFFKVTEICIKQQDRAEIQLLNCKPFLEKVLKRVLKLKNKL